MKKKGLTIYELIATIIVLTIVFLIAVPLAEKAIKKSKITSIKVSADNYVKEVKTKIGNDYVKENIIVGGTYSIDGNKLEMVNREDSTEHIQSVELDISGKLPTSGLICFNDDGDVVRYSMVMDKYVVTKKNNNVTVTSGDNYVTNICDYSNVEK